MTGKKRGNTATVSLTRATVQALDEACRRFETKHNMTVSRNQLMRKIVLDWLERQQKAHGTESTGQP